MSERACVSIASCPSASGVGATAARMCAALLVPKRAMKAGSSARASVRGGSSCGRAAANVRTHCKGVKTASRSALPARKAAARHEHSLTRRTRRLERRCARREAVQHACGSRKHIFTRHVVMRAQRPRPARRHVWRHLPRNAHGGAPF